MSMNTRKKYTRNEFQNKNTPVKNNCTKYKTLQNVKTCFFSFCDTQASRDVIRFEVLIGLEG